jgi:hypothetical protein
MRHQATSGRRKQIGRTFQSAESAPKTPHSRDTLRGAPVGLLRGHFGRKTRFRRLGFSGEIPKLPPRKAAGPNRSLEFLPKKLNKGTTDERGYSSDHKIRNGKNIADGKKQPPVPVHT